MSARLNVRVFAMALFVWAGTAAAQVTVSPGRTIDAVVEDYVREALRSNLALRSQSFEVERQLALLGEARSRFFPQLNLEARYTRAEGGREIALPTGELINPAYRTLNELLAAQGLPPRFSDVPDSSIRFLRETEQDTRLTLRQPLYAPVIPAAMRAQESLLGSARFAHEALARQLQRDVTVGYLDWLRARGNVAIVDASAALLTENLRVNDSLYANGRITQDLVLRARSELLEVQQQQREVVNLESRSRQYVNFLLNRDLDGPLETAEAQGSPPVQAGDATGLRSTALANRPELREQDAIRRAAESRVDAARAARRPELALALDGGIQGEDYGSGSGYNFGIASVLFSMPIFDGGAISSRVAAARATARQAATRREELGRQIELEVQQAIDRLQTAVDSLQTAEARAEAAEAGFRIASRKRDQGVISQVEFIDTRSALTGAQINLNVTRFALLAREAELDFATAATALPDIGVP